MKQIDKFIERAESIYPEPHRTPKYELWKHDVHNYIESTFGADIVKMLDSILRPSQVFRVGDNLQAERNQRIKRAVEFLEELKGRDAGIDLSTSGKAMAQAKEAVQARFNRMNITVSGNATFGDNSPLNQIQVSEFLTALVEEAEKLPDSPEKQSLLQNLKEASKNPTLASIAGGFVGGIVQGLVK